MFISGHAIRANRMPFFIYFQNPCPCPSTNSKLNGCCFSMKSYLLFFLMLEISEILKAEDHVLSAINQLLPQLSSSSSGMKIDYLESLTKSKSTRLFLAKEDGMILGMLSLVFCTIPTGKKAWIEDVVVDQSARGRGLGKALMNHAIKEARKFGAKSVDLTSRPSRESANKLYQALGFQARETNLYRYNLNQ